MFDSIYSSTLTASQFFIMAAASIISGLLFAWIMSFRIHSRPRFFTVVAIIPFIVATIITFVSGNIGAGFAIGGAFSLIRFRSAPGSADDLAAILIPMGSGFAFGMGYIGYGIAILFLMAILYLLLTSVRLFEHRPAAVDQTLMITIPESLQYTDTFKDIFTHYLISYESTGVKTTGMGSMFKLSFKIRMKNPAEEKQFIDELRTKNGNLEISILPYAEPLNQL